MRRFIATALAALFVAPAAQAQSAPDDVLSNVTPQFAQAIPNIPGKSLKTVLVTYAPGGNSPSHTHARSAFILAYVLEGEIVSALNGQPPRTYKAGEWWTESPGDHHGTSANGSKTKPARLLAIFVVDSNDEPLTVPDRH